MYRSNARLAVLEQHPNAIGSASNILLQIMSVFWMGFISGCGLTFFMIGLIALMSR